MTADKNELRRESRKNHYVSDDDETCVSMRRTSFRGDESGTQFLQDTLSHDDAGMFLPCCNGDRHVA